MEVNNIVFNDSKTPKQGIFKHVFVNNNDTNSDVMKNVSFEIEKVKTPFGVSYSEFNNDIKATISLSLDKNQNHIIDFINDFETLLLKTAEDRSDHWFGKELNVSELKTMLKRSLYHKNKDFPPSLTLKVNPNVIVCDENRNVIKLSSIKKGQYVNVKFEIGGIWISNNKFGITWKVIQIESLKYKPKAKPKGDVLSQYAFNDEE